MVKQVYGLLFVHLSLAGGAALAALEPHAPPVRELVRACLAEDQPLAALAAATAAVAHAPRSAAAHAALAGALFRNADFEGAELAARRALALDGQEPDAHVALARCLETQGEKVEAERHLALVLQSDPRHATALRLMTGMLDINSERPQAIEMNRRFVALGPPGANGRLFTHHARRVTALLETLGATQLDVQPPWGERPQEIVLPLTVTEDGLKVEIAFSGELGRPSVKRTCVFDTGEESITLRTETAEAFGAPKVGEIPSSTITGIEEMTLVRVPKLAAGSFALSNTLAGIGSSDIVGPGIFPGYRVKMDFMGRRLVLTRQPKDVQPGPEDLKDAPKGTRRLRVRCLGKLVWFPVHTLNEAGPLKRRPAWGFLDTGCDPPALLLPRYLQALKSEAGKGPLALPFRASLEGAARGEAVDQVLHVLPEFRLQLLGAEVSADRALVAASAASVSQATEAELDLIVGWPVIWRAFKSVEIDFERCVLTVEPRVTAGKR